MNCTQITSFAEIPAIESENTLILLDINETLITYKEKWRVLKGLNMSIRQDIINRIKNEQGQETGQKIIDYIFDNAEVCLLDNNFSKFYEKIKDVPTFALTAIRPGFASVNSTTSVQDIWSNILFDAGIEFDSSYDTVFQDLNENNKQLENLKIANLNKFYALEDAMTHNGIVFCCNLNKGFILTKVLDHLRTKQIAIETVIMVDDVKKNLEQIDCYLSNTNRNINFIGYEITTEKIVEEKLGPIDAAYVDKFISMIYADYFNSSTTV